MSNRWDIMLTRICAVYIVSLFALKETNRKKETNKKMEANRKKRSKQEDRTEPEKRDEQEDRNGVKKGMDQYNRDDLVWEEVSTEHIVQDEWIDFRRSAYRFPDGTVFEPYYSYSRRDYVVVVATDCDGNYLCVRQFRQGIKEVTTEFPAGGVERSDGREYGVNGGNDLTEDGLAAAKRELLEETGYSSCQWSHLLTIPSNATMADNYAHIFMAKNCRKVGGQKLDETEFLNVELHSAREIEELIETGKFQQAVHVMAWLLAKEKEW